MARCTHVTAERHLRGTLVCEDVWTCERPPGGRFDRIGLRRLAACEGASGPVVLYLPGMHMNARVPAGDPRHDLRLYLVDAGFRTWGIDSVIRVRPLGRTSLTIISLASRWRGDGKANVSRR